MAKRYYVSTYEDRLAPMLDSVGIPYLRFQVFCLRCGRYAPVKKQGDSLLHPSFCQFCGISFKQAFACCEPDFLLLPRSHAKQVGVLMVNGIYYHRRKKKIMKDKEQIALLKNYGVKVIIIEDQDMDVWDKSTIAEFLTQAYASLEDHALYQSLVSQDYNAVVFEKWKGKQATKSPLEG